MNSYLRIYFLLTIVSIASAGFGQNLPVGYPVLEEKLRRDQLMGKFDSARSFSNKPIVLHTTRDSTLDYYFGMPLRGKNAFKFSIIRPGFRTELNTHHPYGWNNGPLLPARGLQTYFTGGFHTRIGPISIQFSPQIMYAQNLDYSGFPETYSTSTWRSYYKEVLNRADLPERIGNRNEVEILPGNSGVYFNLFKNQIGISTENIWIGPGISNALMFSNNSAGFPHLKWRTTQPINVWIGNIEYNFIVGKLVGSNQVPFIHTDSTRNFFNPRRDDSRILVSTSFSFAPKIVPVWVGFTRTVQLYSSDIEENTFRSSFSGFFRANSGFDKADQLLTGYFRWLIPTAKAEIYFEATRNDASWNIRDVALSPEHSVSYNFGVSKVMSLNDRNFQITYENTRLERSGLYFYRAEPILYANIGVRHGHTYKGQIIGAGIGPGSNFQNYSIIHFNELNSIGLVFERLIHNNDLHEIAFGKGVRDRNWIENSFGLKGSIKTKYFLIDSKVLLNHSKNYQYQIKNDSSLPTSITGSNAWNFYSSINCIIIF